MTWACRRPRRQLGSLIERQRLSRKASIYSTIVLSVIDRSTRYTWPMRWLAQASSVTCTAPTGGMAAIHLAETLYSHRNTHLLRDLCVRMKPHAKVPAVGHLLDRGRGLVQV